MSLAMRLRRGLFVQDGRSAFEERISPLVPPYVSAGRWQVCSPLLFDLIPLRRRSDFVKEGLILIGRAFFATASLCGILMDALEAYHDRLHIILDLDTTVPYHRRHLSASDILYAVRLSPLRFYEDHR